jgi:hypothetical protein
MITLHSSLMFLNSVIVAFIHLDGLRLHRNIGIGCALGLARHIRVVKLLLVLEEKVLDLLLARLLLLELLKHNKGLLRVHLHLLRILENLIELWVLLGKELGESYVQDLLVVLVGHAWRLLGLNIAVYGGLITMLHQLLLQLL